MKSGNKGFSLLELILVLGIASAVSFMKFQDLKQSQEEFQANSVGQQIKQIGNAVNSYINIRYDKLSILSSVSSGTGTDPGPRTCSPSTNTCIITYQTLVNEGLLSSNFNGINANKSSYSILLKRDGISPNYIINGLVTTNNAWIEGNKVRYDLLGKAMQVAGIDSGITKTVSTVSGYSGSWSENSTDYNNINKVGVLGYRVGYDSSMYTVFLRRDGTLPMTGDLNMGGQDINNAVNITASGTTTSGTLASIGSTNVGGNLTVTGTSTMTGALQVNNNITSKGIINSGGNLIAHNGYGDSISIGGDAAGSDFDLIIGGGKPLNIQGNENGTSYGTVQVRGEFNIASGTGMVKKEISLQKNGQIYNSGNINSDGIISGQYFIPTSTFTSGTTCTNSGAIAKDSSGSLLTCSSGIWQDSDSKQGALCGFSSNDKEYGNINVYLCKGYNPLTACPPGYVRGIIFQANTNYLYSCIVTKSLTGN